MADLALGVDLGGTFVKILGVDLRGRITYRTQLPSTKPDELLRDLSTLTDRVGRAIRSRGHRIVALGLGVAGFIDQASGRIVQSPNIPALKGFNFGARFARVPLPVVLENDANCAALGEHWIGAGRGSKQMCCMTLGTGIGGGFVFGGSLYRGSEGMAGEVGHMIVAPRGRPCPCGNRGCLERYGSVTALVQEYEAALLERDGKAPGKTAQNRKIKPPTGEEITRRARRGDAASRRAFGRVSKYLGLGAANVSTLLNLDCIVMAGGLSKAWDLISGPLKKSFRENSPAALAGSVRIVPARHAGEAGALGAAYLAFRRIGLLQS